MCSVWQDCPSLEQGGDNVDMQVLESERPRQDLHNDSESGSEGQVELSRSFSLRTRQAVEESVRNLKVVGCRK